MEVIIRKAFTIDLDDLHDPFVEAYLFHDRKVVPTEEMLIKLWGLLPERTQFMAFQHGSSDTDFCDNVYEFLCENIEK